MRRPAREPRDYRRPDWSDSRYIFPDWLPALRAAGYRPERLPEIQRRQVQEGLKIRGAVIDRRPT
jgi:hypothetical protein